MLRSLALRVLLALAAGALAAGAVYQVLALDRERSALLAAARELEVDSPELDRLLRRAEDGDRARVLLARTLLVRALEADPSMAGASQLRRKRLEAAAGLARDGLGRRPASWEAATVAGAATYLAWSLERDPRLLQEYRAWEEPLLLARRLAPRRPEPPRYLVAAYLELWPALSDAKRNLTRELIAEALEERRAFGRLIEPWLEVSGGDLRPVPDTPWAWAAIERFLAGRGDWAGVCHAREARHRTQAAALAAQLGEADRLLRGGELLDARQAFFAVVASAPAERAYADLVDRALRAVPYGPVRPAGRPAFGAWLRWSFHEALRDDEPPLSAEALGRLRAVVTGDGPADPADAAAAAWTYLVAGDRAGAERLERQAAVPWSGAWGPYWIEKAELLAKAGDPDAEQALLLVHPDWQRHPAYWQARRQVAAAAGDRPAVAAASVALEGLAARSWSVLDWSWEDGRARLDLFLGRGAKAVAVSLAEVPERGAAVSLSLDGGTLGCVAAAAGKPLVLPAALSPGLHRLEIETVSAAGGRVWPGPVEVRDRLGPLDERSARAAPRPPPPPAPPG